MRNPEYSATHQISDATIPPGYDGLLSWLAREDNLLKIIAIFTIPLLGFECALTFSQMTFSLAHDEAEHLHVVFALARGEVPYRDFIENHPVLFHLVLLWFKQLLHLSSGIEVYWLGKMVVLTHFLALLFLLCAGYAGFARRNGMGDGRHAWVLILGVFALLPVWLSGEWSNYPVWQLRPDWPCYFYAYLCVALHFRFHRQLLSHGHIRYWPLIIGAIAGGFSMALLAKAAYVFVPYVLTLLVMTLDDPPSVLRQCKPHWRVLLKANFLFVIAGLISFFGFVLCELYFSGASSQQYFRANFLLNSVKHLVAVSALDTNPFNTLRNFLGLPFGAVVLLGICAILMLLHAYRDKQTETFFLLTLVLVTVEINAMLPAYSNGLVWVHYFIPSLVMLVVLLTLVASRILGWSSRMAVLSIATKDSEKGSYRLLPVLLLLPLFYAVAMNWQQAIDDLDNLRFTNHLRQVITRDVARIFFTERYLPNNFTYLTFSPQKVPVAAPQWGYHFMLGTDKRLWPDNYELGIGPDPKTYWRTLYQKQKPEMVMLTGYDDFKEKWKMLNRRQGVDIGWLWSALTVDYKCMYHPLVRKLSGFVRNDLVPRMAKANWRPCLLIDDRRSYPKGKSDENGEDDDSRN